MRAGPGTVRPGKGRAALLGALAPVLALALGAGACSGPGRPLFDRQDPARFESCADPVGRAAYEEALVLLQAARDEEALAQLRTAVERCPEHVLAHGHYQDLALQLGGAAEAAMRAFYDALPPDADSPVPAYVKARLVGSSFERKGAVEELLKHHGDFAYGWLSLGRLYRGVNQLSDAAESFQRAIDRHPGLLAAHLELAETLVELGRYAEAELPFENYLAGAPNDRSTIRALVNLLLYRLGKPEEARPWIDRLLAADPRDERARMDLAAAEWRSGRLEESLDRYLDVLAQSPDNARAALNIGHLHFDALAADDAGRREHWPKARQAYRLFLQLVRPEEGHDYFDAMLAVPYRLKAIDDLLGPDPDTAPPSLEDLR